MRRLFLLILISAATAAAQFHWTCSAKDGRFIKEPNGDGKKFYCWDGQIFSDSPGYTPPPGYVLAYWEEVRRKSDAIRRDIEQKGKEMAEHVHQAQEDTARMNRERAQADKAFNDELNRKVAEQRAGQGSARPAVRSANQIVSIPERPESAPIAPPVSRAKASEVQVGMDRAAVEGILGKPHGSLSIPEDDGLVEVLNYTLDDHGTAKVRLEKSKVVSVKMIE